MRLLNSPCAGARFVVLAALASLGSVFAAPVITTQPARTVAVAGAPAALQVVVTGAAAPSYQWRKFGTVITGANQSVLPFAAPTMADAGAYDVVVTDGTNSVVSQAALFEVQPAVFGDTYRVDPAFAHTFERLGAGVNRLALDAQGGAYLTGTFTTLDGVACLGVARTTNHAQLDASFSVEVDGVISGALPLGNTGQLLLAGSFTTVNGSAHAGLVRVSADGHTVDPTFVPPAGANYVSQVVRQPDGRLLVSGMFAAFTHGRLLRLEADGSLDPTWIPTGAGLADIPTSLALQPDGKILAGGSITYDGVARNYLVRLNFDGTLDPSFSIGTGFDGAVTLLALQPDGKILAAGYFSSCNGTPAPYLARLNPDGSLDTSFTSAGSIDSAPLALALQPNGGVVLTGNFTTYNGSPSPNLVRLGATGARDTTFAGARSTNGSVAAAAVDPATGDLVLVGAFTQFGTTACSGLLRLDAAGNTLHALAPGGRVNAWVNSAVPVPGGAWVIGGDFTHIDGIACPRLARLLAGGAIDPAFAVGTGFDGTVSVVERDGAGRLLVGGSFGSCQGRACRGLARLNADGSYDESFYVGTGFGPNAATTSIDFLSVLRDGRIVAAGSFTAFNSQTTNNVIRLNSWGDADPTFNRGIIDLLLPIGMSVDADGRMVFGSWWSGANNWTFSRGGGVRVNADGSIDPVFGGSATVGAFDISNTGSVVQPDGKFITCGFFNQYAGTPRAHLARFNADGTLDTTYGQPTGAYGVPYMLSLLPDGRVLTSGYAQSSLNPQAVLRFNTDGTLDPAFSIADCVQTSGSYHSNGAPRYTDDGRLLVPGQSSIRGSTRQMGLSMLVADPVPAPVITTAPIAQIATPGSATAFTVAATGDAPFSYQWFKDGLAIAGATNDSLSFASVSATDLGSYTVAVTNVHGTTVSIPVRLWSGMEVKAPSPRVVASSGTPSTLGVDVIGAPTLQWRKLGQPLAGETNATLVFLAVAMADAAWYDVVYDDGFGVKFTAPIQLAVAPSTTPTTLRLDPTFAPVFETTAGAQIRALAPGPANTLYAGGTFSLLGGARRLSLAKFNADLSLATGFAPELIGTVTSLAVQSDGRLLVGGSLTSLGGTAIRGLVRLNSDGTLDASYTGNSAPSGTVNALALKADGKLYLGGSFFTVAAEARTNLARLNADGAVDPSFVSPDLNGSVTSLALQADGHLLVGGNFTTVGGTSAPRLVRLNADGTWDTSFNVGTGFNSTVQTLALLSGGRVAVGGNFTMYNGVATNRFVVLGPTGAAEPVGTGFDGTVSRLLALADGRLAVTGSFTTYNGTSGLSNLAVLGSAGALDTSFAATARPGANGSELLEIFGGLAVAGSFQTVGATATSGVARYELSGPVAATSAGGFRSAANALTVAPAAAGKWYAAGNFTHLDGQPAGGIVRFGADGSRDPSFVIGAGITPAGNSVVKVVVQGDGRLVLAGSFSGFNGSTRNNIVRLNADGSLDSTFNPGTGFGGAVADLLLQPDGRILAAGSFATFNGVSRNRIARLNTDGSLDLTFNPGTGFNNSVTELDVRPDGRVLVAGSFTTFNGSSRSYLVQLTAQGAADPEFSPSYFASNVRSAAFLPDGHILAAGPFSTVDGIAAPGFVNLAAPGYRDWSNRYASTTAASGFRVVPETDGRALVLFSGGISDGYQSRTVLARLGTDGSPDFSLEANDVLSTTTYRPAITDDGSVLLPAAVGARGTALIRGLVRLKQDASPSPQLTAAPVSHNATLGTTTTFTVGATGEGTLTYQWLKDGVALTGETAATLTLPNVQPDAFARYTVRVANAFGAITTRPVMLGVTGVGGPAYKLLDHYYPMVEGNEWLFEGPVWSGVTHTRRRVTDLAKSITGYTGTGPITPVAQTVAALENDFGIYAAGSFTTDERWTDFVTTNGGQLTMWASDSDSGRTTRTDVGGKFPLQLAVGESSVTACNLYEDGVYRGIANIAVRLIARETVTVPAGTYPNSLHVQQVIVTPDRGFTTKDEWWVAGLGIVKSHNVEEDGEVDDDALLQFTGRLPLPPTLTAAPAGASIANGATATLNVNATSPDPIAYQWYVGDSGNTSAPIVGATSATFTTPALTAWARYWVRITNRFGNTDSPTLLVEVANAPMVLADWTAQPGVPPNARGALDTPAGDGVSNLLKFAFGVPPMDSAAAHLPTVVVITPPAAPPSLGVEYAMNPLAQNVRFALEASSDMVIWTEVVAITEPLGANPDGTQLVRLREAVPPAAVAKRFVRLKVEIVP